uniref:Uncharacterized protein n=1 Tax=Arundo donax TaxID=35708 RepID=A0A0A9HHY4_ARUDO
MDANMLLLMLLLDIDMVYKMQLSPLESTVVYLYNLVNL